jgi:hypothetical protein
LVFELELSFETGRIRVGNGILKFENSVESPYYTGYRSLLPDTGPRESATGGKTSASTDDTGEGGSVDYLESGRTAYVTEDTAVDNLSIGKTGYFEGMIADAVACVRTDKEPDSSAVDGLEVMKFIRSMKAIL